MLKAAVPERRPVARAVAESLGRMGTPSAKEALLQLLRRSDDPEWTRMIQTELNLLEERASRVMPALKGTAAGAPVGSVSAPRVDIAAPAPPEGGIPWSKVLAAAAGIGALGAAAAALRARTRRR